MTTKVSLSPLKPKMVTALRAVTVRPEQVVFSGQPAEVLDDPAPDMDIHVVLSDQIVVGMFRIDHGYYTRYPFASSDTPGLRTYLIDEGMQGRGISGATCKLLKPYLAEQYPSARAVFLTVNLRNPVARKVYMRGGFVDIGEEWPWGDAGPQNILRLDLHS